MASSVRVVLLNTDLNYAVELRNELLEVHGLKIVAEVDDPAMLLQAVQQFRCDLAILQLDPQPEVILAVAETVIAENPTLPMIAISGNCDTAMVLKAMRAGLREYLERPPDLDRLQDVVSKVASSKDASTAQGQLITVVGSAGGVGANARDTQDLRCPRRSRDSSLWTTQFAASADITTSTQSMFSGQRKKWGLNRF